MSPVPEVDWSFFSMARYLQGPGTGDERVLGAGEWEGMLNVLVEAGRLAQEATPDSPVDRASTFRGLLQMLYFGLERTLGSADPARPAFSRPWPLHLFDYGAGNPDAVYRTVGLRDDLTYRISGRLGNASFVSLEFFDGIHQTGSLLPRHLNPAADGTFEVLFGPSERPGNWRKIVPGTSYLLTREFFADWESAVPSMLDIRAEGAIPDARPVMSADRVARELAALGRWLVETVRMFGGMQRSSMLEFANSFKPQAVRADSDLPTIYHGFWDLSPQEALVIETPVPAVDYWGFQLSNSVWNTLDFANRQTSINPSQAHIDDDGILRIVVSAIDPLVPNWLDTMGLRQGAIHVRLAAPGVDPSPSVDGDRDLAATVNNWMATLDDTTKVSERSAPHPLPVARMMKAEEIRNYLPATTPTITPPSAKRCYLAGWPR